MSATAAPASAQDSHSSSLPILLPESTSKLTLPKVGSEKRRQSASSLSLVHSEYVSAGQTYYRWGAASSAQDLSLVADERLRLGARWELRGLIKDQYSASEQWNYVNVREAYGSYEFSRPKISVGRKLHNWAEWEQEWRQGIFEPRYMQNKWQMESAGLTGVFITSDGRVEEARGRSSYPGRGLRATAGALVNVPDFGPHAFVKDNRFSSRNPWFHPPAQSFEFLDQTGDIHYKLTKPVAEEVVPNLGGIAKLELFNQNSLSRLTYAYKPAPQFLLSFPTRNQAVIAETGTFMIVDVHPRVFYHHVANVDQIWSANGWLVSGSVTYERPEDRNAPPELWKSQEVAEAWIYSASVARDLETSGPKSAQVRLGALKIVGGDAPDSGEFQQPTTVFERRYQFLEAYSLGLFKSWRGFAMRPLETDMRLIYDRIQNGGIVRAHAGMFVQPQWRIDLEADFLGLLAGTNEVDDGFLSVYRANDRVGLGMTYVF